MVLLAFLGFVGLASAQVSLPAYNVDINAWSVSGISSGACMATQLHVAYSDDIMGCGMVAGAPYYCSEGSTSKSLNCMDSPESTDVNHLIQETDRYAQSGDVAATSNMAGDRVFVFQGSVDTVVFPPNGPLVQQYYENYGANVQTEFTYNAEHSFVTDFYGGPCDQLNNDYINNCNYHGAYEILNHIYGGLTHVTKPTGSETLSGELYEYTQRDFFTSSVPSAWSMADSGYVYVPSACVSGQQCKLHVALHGCDQGSYILGTTFVENTGYLQTAELNDIIVLFPQTINSFTLPVNGFGCWDWWGYNTNLYATRNGGQVLALWRMMRQVSGLPW